MRLFLHHGLRSGKAWVWVEPRISIQPHFRESTTVEPRCPGCMKVTPRRRQGDNKNDTNDKRGGAFSHRYVQCDAILNCSLPCRTTPHCVETWCGLCDMMNRTEIARKKVRFESQEIVTVLGECDVE